MTGKGFGKNRMKKEKIAILAASGFVLAALTMTGVYMSEQNQAESDDGYTVDFEALEESVENKNQEIAQNLENQDLTAKADQDKDADKSATDKATDVKKDTTTKDTKKTETKDQADTKSQEPEEVPQESVPSTEAAPQQEAAVPEETLEAGTTQVINSPALDYAESEGLVRPLNGEAILPFSMESSIYFQTLDQYKYNPAMMIAAEPGTSVLACADGQVSKIYESRELGNIVEVDLGNGYTMTYGQLQDVCVTEGSYITAGSMIARVAAPSIYYTVEGSNLYLQLEKDGEPINPEPLFQ